MQRWISVDTAQASKLFIKPFMVTEKYESFCNICWHGCLSYLHSSDLKGVYHHIIVTTA